MSNYVIGDVQGCFDSLEALLNTIDYDSNQDSLWFAGDLVNRGPKSLETLRFIKSLGDKAYTVLGNHDLHLLALACGVGRSHSSDTIAEVVAAADATELIDWLRSQPLVLRLPGNKKRLLVHAGILPQWRFTQALALSAEVQAVLGGSAWKYFMAELYGNKPDAWDNNLQGHDRLRLVVNVCTRMRMLRNDGSVDFKFKQEPADAPPELKAWFDVPRTGSGDILFGHWSTLPQLRNTVGYCLDTGCVWGGQLTALRLEDERVFQVNALEPPLPTVP